MSILTHLLFVLLTLRLLMPPGICVCKLSSPAARLLASVLGSQPLPPPIESNDAHDDGCPAGPLKEALGLRPAGPGPIELPLVAILPVLSEDILIDASACPIALPLCDPPRPPLCVSHCALRC